MVHPAIASLAAAQPDAGTRPLPPASPLAWPAGRRAIFAVIALFALWLAVGWALGWLS